MQRIVYLHGFASGPSSSKARLFRERLAAAGADVVVPDLAGGDFEHLTLSGQLARLADATGKGQVRLIGSSMGGYLAALYAARHPEVERLVLMAPAFGFGRRWPERLGKAEMERWRSTGRMEVFHYAEGQPRQLAYDLIEDAARYEDYPDVHQPTLIFHGSKDDVVPVAYSEQFSAGRENVRLEIVDSGHDLLDALDRIVPESLDWLLK